VRGVLSPCLVTFVEGNNSFRIGFFLVDGLAPVVFSIARRFPPILDLNRVLGVFDSKGGLSDHPVPGGCGWGTLLAAVLFQLLVYLLAPEGGEVIHEELAVEVVDLVLDTDH